MTYALDLKFPLTRDLERRGSAKAGQLYVTGENCASIDRDPGGGWWVVVDNHRSYWVPDEHVQGVERTPDRYNGPELPAYAEAVEAGYRCKLCAQVFEGLHGIRTHHGRAHVR